MRSLLRLAISTVFAVEVTGCYSFHPYNSTAKHAPEIGTHVRARFADPVDIAAVRPSGDTLTLHGVRDVEGRVTAVRGDTLFVRLMGHPDSVTAKLQTTNELDVGRVSKSSVVLIAFGFLVAIAAVLLLRLHEESPYGGT